MNKKQRTTRETTGRSEGKVMEDRKQANEQLDYKDTMFRILFRDRENLLSLYNAVNKTAYTDVDSLEITTLENAVYTKYKNDVSFIFGFELMLYEHQSTVNPNMPLRNLTYVTEILQGLTRDENLYGTKLVKVPSPRFAVFYNGTSPQPVQEVLRLSDSFLKEQEQPQLELLVTVYNINWGYNRELMETCRTLEEYARYVDLVRKAAEDKPFGEAVEETVDYCIKNGILSDFLSKNRAEAIAVSIFEYDEVKHIESERKEAFEEGERKGLEQGIAKGLEQGMAKGLEQGVEQGLEQGIHALIAMSQKFKNTRQETVEYLKEELKISQEKAEESVEKYWH